MTNQSLLQKFIIQYYAISFCYDLILAYPIYAILFSQNGLSVLQISYLMMWWCLTSAAFEVPSGALADYWQRKYLLTIAPLIKSGCFILWFFADGSFVLYALDFTLWSLGSSFVSGTKEAMLYDTLKQSNRTHEYEKILGRNRIFHNMACGISCISGGIVAHYSIDLSLGLSVPPLIGASLVAVSMAEPERHTDSQSSYYFHHFVNAWNEIKENPTIRYTFLYQLCCIGIFGDMEEFDPLYFSLVGLPLYALGAVLFFRMVLESFGNFFAYRLKKYKRIEYITPLITGCMLIMVGAFPAKHMIAVLLLSYFLIAPVDILINGKMQHAINGASRATVISAAMLFSTLLALFFMLAFGWLSDTFGLGSGYMFFGGILVIFSFWVQHKK